MVCAEGPQISAGGEFEGCLKSILIVPVGGEGVGVNKVARILLSASITCYMLVNGDGKSSRPRLMAIHTKF
jgi:hypothetical protein